ncbi:unnamed protein product [Periconia digitata]|uniref:N-acetyltransferase domain-containing protein n=1 Tax=Periconia digitata TaxID=1303443 RepID=A0A9W4XSF8_9PLEO|nr:unnamed protein product [Periconia digitata]
MTHQPIDRTVGLCIQQVHLQTPSNCTTFQLSPQEAPSRLHNGIPNHRHQHLFFFFFSSTAHSNNPTPHHPPLPHPRHSLEPCSRFPSFDPQVHVPSLCVPIYAGPRYNMGEDEPRAPLPPLRDLREGSRGCVYRWYVSLLPPPIPSISKGGRRKKSETEKYKSETKKHRKTWNELTQLVLVLYAGIGAKPGTDASSHTAEIGYWISEAHAGRGLSTEAVAAYVDWCFESRVHPPPAVEGGGKRLTRMHAEIFSGNAASSKSLSFSFFSFLLVFL